MGGLAHYLENDGLATSQISLIRIHTEIIRPPRALWVPFILGRPLGQPGDAAFQRRVLSTALGLLERPEADAPVLVDHLEEAIGGIELDGLSCPVSYAPTEGDGSLRSRLSDELAGLRTWHDLGTVRTGRTAFGVSGLAIDEIGEVLAAAVDGNLPVPPEGLSVGDLLRMAGEDLKAFVTEAAEAQPGEMSAFALKAWFWDQTVAGETLLAAYRASKGHENDDWRLQAPIIIPAELR